MEIDIESAPTSAAGLVKSEVAHPIALDLLMLHRYGPEWLGWDIEVLRRALRDDYGVKEPLDSVLGKMQACRTLHMVDTFWTEWHIFSPCVMALNGNYPDFHNMQAPLVGECMMAVDCANRIRQDMPFSEEVRLFMGVLHLQEGVFVPQEPLGGIPVPFNKNDFDVDVDEIERVWPEVRRTGIVTGKNPITHGQLARMLECHRYLESWRAQLDKQLKVLA